MFKNHRPIEGELVDGELLGVVDCGAGGGCVGGFCIELYCFWWFGLDMMGCIV